MYRVASLTLAVVVMTAAPGRAAETPREGQQPALLSSAVASAAKDVAPATPVWAVDRPERRPTLLPALYGTYAALQVMDVYSTRRAIGAGATEANPVLKSAGNAKVAAIKAAAGAGTIFFAERAWKKNRAGAIVLMAALNGVTAAVVARNTHNATRR